MSVDQKDADLVKIVRHFLTENMDIDEASKTLFVEEKNIQLQETDVTDEDFKQIILNVTNSLVVETE